MAGHIGRHRRKGVASVIQIRDDEEISTDDFNALLRELGFRTQEEARLALGVTQAYISQLKNGVKRVLPQTSLHKLLQALQREKLRGRGNASSSSSL